MRRYVTTSLHHIYNIIWVYGYIVQHTIHAHTEFADSEVTSVDRATQTIAAVAVGQILYYNVILYYAIHYDDDVTRDGGFIFFSVVSTRAHTCTIYYYYYYFNNICAYVRGRIVVIYYNGMPTTIAYTYIIQDDSPSMVTFYSSIMHLLKNDFWNFQTCLKTALFSNFVLLKEYTAECKYTNLCFGKRETLVLP